MKDDEADDCEQPAKHWGDTAIAQGFGCAAMILVSAAGVVAVLYVMSLAGK